MTVVTRFAPSPTGFLHIGGARTALFNWLFARHHGGQFLLRIEDTDRQRSKPEAVEAIYEGLKWLGLDWDGDPLSQFSRVDRHVEVAKQLLAEGKAYHCYWTPDELTAMREAARAEGRSGYFDPKWRDADPATAPEGVPPVVRLKAPRDGETVVQDEIQGEVRTANAQMDDMILLRADGTPTYMLAVVVDDHDMGVTHVIRGDDHLTNTFRQMQLYQALDWTPPTFAHQSLIHGDDGKKLSKRHGALGAEVYRDMGFLPEAMRNYLLRLGWSHGDDEIFSTEQAIEWFNLENVGRAAARFDMEKLTTLNGHYIRHTDDAALVDHIAPRLETELGVNLDEAGRLRLQQGMPSLKERAKTLVELAEAALFYVRPRPLVMTDKAAKLLNAEALETLRLLSVRLSNTHWTRDALENLTRETAEELDLKLGKVAQPLRAALTGTNVSPPIFEVMEILGQEEVLARLQDAQKGQ
ncbi:glutamate--tRNA ligase [Magnetospira sp. QH-2]|uniref:glutamate--tRNA ligase n=1 Tax=Magnetospira sp. (strain QH-2) TaxID=1288970 RepID=UPI0003E81280|nr:glutamate--tRNA ligase [Magnetospira sp. QH-2]CCQ73969.1 Glutamyl-tRNA synthetase (Glutamate--tRNA ligase) (GluRS) [Magnetospira sp. QH-2]